jgi:hypothetical protein
LGGSLIVSSEPPNSTQQDRDRAETLETMNTGHARGFWFESAPVGRSFHNTNRELTVTAAAIRLAGGKTQLKTH